MKIINETQVIDWLSERNLLCSNNSLSIPDFAISHSFKITDDSGTKTNISRAIGTLVTNYSYESLLWINEYGIWPSCEDVNLFNGFRRSLGENEPIYIKPGHLFRIEDIDNIQSIIAMILYFVWGAFIITESKDIVIRISHDEYIDIYSNEDIDISFLKNLCDAEPQP